jgi:uncharacterized membrane protein
LDSYLTLKTLHILSATILIGTGAGIAFFMFMAARSKNIPAIYFTSKHVVLADWIFTTPAVVTQLVTGFLLMENLGYNYSSPWFYWVIALFIFIGACWLPVVVIQYRLRRLAKIAVETDQLDPQFNSLMRIWTLLGVPAFCAIVILLWLMIFKP